MRRRFTLGPLPISFEADRPGPIADFMANYLETVSLSDGMDGPGAGREVSITVLSRIWPEPSPILVPGEAVCIRLGSMKILEDDEFLYIDFHETAIFRVSKETGDAEGAAYLKTFQDESLWCDNILFRLLTVILRVRGLYMIHAAGAGRDGKAFVFVGGNGSGKSTSAISLAARGWEYLGDDGLIWDGTRVYPFPRSPRLSPSVAGRLGVEGWRIEERMGEDLLAPPKTGRRPLIPVLLLFPEIAARGSHRLEAAGRETVRRVVGKNSDFSGIEERLRSFPMEGIEAVPARTLILGPDIEGMGEFIAALWG